MTPERKFADRIMDMTPEEFDAWADKHTTEEIQAATKIIQQAINQLREEAECLIDEDQCFIEEQLFLDSRYGSFPEALEVLSKFTLNKPR